METQLKSEKFAEIKFFKVDFGLFSSFSKVSIIMWAMSAYRKAIVRKPEVDQGWCPHDMI